jgi:hypothetical protein
VGHFIKVTLGWSYILFTITTTKLPPNWKNPRTKMTYKVAYLVKTYNIPTTLVINTNETSVHLIHTRKERTHIQKGKNIHVLGIEDKRQITSGISSLVDGNLSPLHIIFIRSTITCLPPCLKPIG